MEKEIVEKQTPVDLYLMIPHQVKEGEKEFVRIQLIKANKIKSFEGILPTKEILETHFAAERVRIEIDREQKKLSGETTSYIPQPLYLQIQSSIFANILEEARGINPNIPDNYLSLSLGSTLPCCIITPQEEPKQFTKQILKTEQND